MYILLLRYFMLQLTIGFGEETSVISEEKYDGEDVAREAIEFNSHRSNRRFDENLKDNEWHVAHLRDEAAEHEEASCRRMTPDERAHRYRRILREDGSRVKFVSSDPIPPDENIMDIIDPCMTIDGSKIKKNKDTHKRVTEPINNTTVIEPPSNINNTGDNTTKNTKLTTAAVSKTDSTTESNRDSDQVTTEDAKEPLTTASDRKHGKRKKIRREGEDYQFSSVEYYDEMQDFDESQCPEDVKVIVLQVDQLRAYDIECELMIEWRSLE